MSEHRQKILLSVLGLMGLLFVGDRLWTSLYQDPILQANKRAEQHREKIGSVKQDKKRLLKWRRRLKDLAKRSLPGDVDAARTLYQGWLTNLADQVELQNRQVDSGEPRTGSGYRVLPFSLRGSGTLDQLTALLYQFYEAPHLHRIKTLTLTPVAGSRQLSVNVAIDAILFDSATARAELASGTGQVLASQSYDDYRTIARRNIFSTSGGVDAAEFTALTAIVWVDGEAEVWFTNQLDDTIQKRRLGDAFWIDGFECEIAEISRRDVVLLADNQRWLLTLSDRLSDATALPAEF